MCYSYTCNILPSKLIPTIWVIRDQCFWTELLRMAYSYKFEYHEGLPADRAKLIQIIH